MAHNVRTEPSGGLTGKQQVLTVSHTPDYRGQWVSEVEFRNQERRLFVTGTGIVEGEDLYALREFLAELPEGAFFRPADPVEKKPRWTLGDLVTPRAGSHILYRRGERHWDRIVRESVHLADSADEWISHAVDDRCYIVLAQQNKEA